MCKLIFLLGPFQYKSFYYYYYYYYYYWQFKTNFFFSLFFFLGVNKRID